jgi:uncharacterized protein YcnI
MNKINFIAVLGFATLPATAFAHATLTVGEAPADSYYVATVQIPHGCDGKATNEVRVKLPEGFISAKPMPKAGWQIEIIKGKYQKAYDNHGKAISEGPLEIRWKGGDLPDEYYDTFTISGKLSGIPAGAAVAFATTQLCGKDGKVAWSEIPAPGQNAHSLKHPAPMLMLTAAEGHDHHGDQMAEFKPVKLGDLELTAGFVKAMTKGQPAGGGFVTITNHGHHDDRLIAAETVAGVDHMELHEMAMQGDVMKMRMLKDGIAVPAGKTVELVPGGLHMMFLGVKEPFAAGTTVKVKLTFEKAGSVEVELPVIDLKAMDHAGHKM